MYMAVMFNRHIAHFDNDFLFIKTFILDRKLKERYL